MLECCTVESRGHRMACLVDRPTDQRQNGKVMLYKHGFMGHMISSHRMLSNLAHQMVELGYTVVRFDCVGAGSSEGNASFTTIPGELQDTLAVMDFVRRELKPSRLIVHGYSFGGCISPLACAKAETDGLLLWSPVSAPMDNFRHLLGQQLFDQGRQGQDVDWLGDRVGSNFFKELDNPLYDPLAAIKSYDKPLRVIHGSGDKDVLLKNGQAYAAAAKDSQLHIVKDATHCFDAVPHQEELFAVTLKYVKELLG